LRIHRPSNRIVAAVVITGIALIAQVGLADATASVPPATYAAAVCAAVATMHSNTVAADAPLKAASQAYKDQPTQDTATQLRQALVVYLQQARGFFGDTMTAFQKAGVPAGKNGARFARALNQNFQTATGTLDPLIQQAGAIDVTSSAAFAQGIQGVFARLTAASAASKKQARQAAAFKGVPAPLHRIVSYVRGGGNTCPAN
jgi:hypothetical protein